MMASRTNRRAMAPVEWLLLVALSVLWGGSFFFAEVALAELPPLTVVLDRVGLAAVALALLVRAAGGHRAPRDLRLWARSWSWGCSTT